MQRPTTEHTKNVCSVYVEKVTTVCICVRYKSTTRSKPKRRLNVLSVASTPPSSQDTKQTVNTE